MPPTEQHADRTLHPGAHCIWVQGWGLFLWILKPQPSFQTVHYPAWVTPAAPGLYSGTRWVLGAMTPPATHAPPPGTAAAAAAARPGCRPARGACARPAPCTPRRPTAPAPPTPRCPARSACFGTAKESITTPSCQAPSVHRPLHLPKPAADQLPQPLNWQIRAVLSKSSTHCECFPPLPALASSCPSHPQHAVHKIMPAALCRHSPLVSA